VIEVQSEKVVTVTIKLSEDKATELRQWLTWALAVWGQTQKYPILNDEIFNDIQGVPGLTSTKSLNYNTAVLIRNGL
jgi:hypothetical protein